MRNSFTIIKFKTSILDGRSRIVIFNNNDLNYVINTLNVNNKSWSILKFDDFIKERILKSSVFDKENLMEFLNS